MECQCRNGLVFTRDRKGIERLYRCYCPLGEQYARIKFKGVEEGFPVYRPKIVEAAKPPEPNKGVDAQ